MTPIQWWADLYENSAAVGAIVMFAHLLGILVGGGIALATDRGSLQLRPTEPDLPGALARLASVHRLVVAGLALTFVSGALMALSELEVFLGAWLYWTKLALVAILLANGFIRMKAEQALMAGGDAWGRFRATSAASVVLWIVILLAGSFLTVVA